MTDSLDSNSTAPNDNYREEVGAILKGIETALQNHSGQQRRDKSWMWFKRVGFCLFLLMGLSMYVVFYMQINGYRPGPSDHSVGVVVVDGPISSEAVASAPRIVALIQRACYNDQVQAVIIKINSPGGSPSHAERIGQAVRTCEKPTVAAIDGLGASAAYMIALQADSIVANRYSMVGSIGAVITGFKAHHALAKLGVEPVVHASGDLKNALSPWYPSTPKESQMAQTLVDDVANVFRDSVIERRGEKLSKDSTDLYSGRVWLGDEALRLGLIDEVLVYDELVKRDFPGLVVHVFKPQRKMQEMLQMTTWVDAISNKVAAQLMTPTLQ